MGIVTHELKHTHPLRSHECQTLIGIGLGSADTFGNGEATSALLQMSGEFWLSPSHCQDT